MKVKILKPCRDKVTKKCYEVGEIIELTEERYNNAPIGFVEIVTESTVTKKRGRPKKKAVE